MGADLCMAYVFHRQGVTPSWEKAWAEIDRLTDDEIRTLGVSIEADWMFDDVNFDAMTPDDVKEVKDTLKSWIQALVESLDHPRQVSSILIFGWVMYVSGGMSFGDDPTDVFSIWTNVNNLGDLGVKTYHWAGLDWPPTGPEQYIVQEEALS